MVIRVNGIFKVLSLSYSWVSPSPIASPKLSSEILMLPHGAKKINLLMLKCVYTGLRLVVVDIEEVALSLL